MAVGLSAALAPKPFRPLPSAHHAPKPTPILHLSLKATCGARRKRSFTVRFVAEKEEQKQTAPTVPQIIEQGSDDVIDRQILIPARVSEKLARKRSERFTYLVAAVMPSFGVTSMSVMAVYFICYL